MISRVIFVGDLCRGAQAGNVLLIERLFSPVLKRFGVPFSSCISDINRKVVLHEWLDDWKSSLARGGGLNPEDFYDAAVIGFEVPSSDLSLLSSVGVPWVNLAIHPVRFLDDLYFNVETSFDFDLRPMSADDALIDLCVNMLKIRYGAVDGGKPSVLAIFGQTPIDKSIYFDGCFKSLDFYFDKIDEIAAGFSKNVYRPHPNATNHDMDRLVCDRYGASYHVGADVYELLVCGGVKAACSISSSILVEAPYFGVKSEYLDDRAKRFGRPVSYKSLLDNSLFWSRGLLGREENVECDSISGVVPMGYLRQVIESWGYVPKEKEVRSRIDEVATMAQTAISKAKEVDGCAKKALELAQQVANELSAGAKVQADSSVNELNADLNAALKAAYDSFSRGEYDLAYKMFLEVDGKVEPTALLENDIAVTAYKAGYFDIAMSRFLHSSDMGGGRLVVENLIDIICNFRRDNVISDSRNIGVRDGDAIADMPESGVSTDSVDNSSTGVDVFCDVCRGELEDFIENYKRCAGCGCLVFCGSNKLITAQNSGSPERNEMEKNLIRISRIKDRVLLGRVVDFGCGDGYFVKCLRDQCIQADGVDIGTELSLSDFDDNSISAFSMVEVIEHLSRPRLIIELMRRKLRVGGIIYMETTFSNNCTSFPHPYVSPALGHVLIHSYESISILGEACGFDVEFLNDNVVVMKKIG